MPSSVIAHISYNEAGAMLTIRFVSGMVYEYEKVPLHVYVAMKAARSKGTYFNRYIKGHFQFKKAANIGQ